MKKLFFALTICVSVMSDGVGLKCYFCSPYEAIAQEKPFTPEQCEKNQTEVTCFPNLDKCVKAHQSRKMEDGRKMEHELRGFTNDQPCNELQTRLEHAEMFGWDYQLACCNSELCNKGDMVASEALLPWFISALSWVMAMV